MLAKIIALSLILVLIVSTVILQMAVFGNYEEMEELEYDEYQIRIDYKKLTAGIARLFTRNQTVSRRHPTNENKETVSEDDNTAPTIQEAPTVPTVPTRKKYGEE